MVCLRIGTYFQFKISTKAGTKSIMYLFKAYFFFNFRSPCRVKRLSYHHTTTVQRSAIDRRHYRGGTKGTFPPSPD